MYRKLKRMLNAAVLLSCIFALYGGTGYVHAASVDDGTYTIDYVIKKPDDESVSMANDYWEKPATVIVSSGTITLQMTINHSEWVTQFKIPDGNGYTDAKVISRDSGKNTRLVEFPVASLDKPMLSQIHVTVPEIDYDHDYTIRFVYDTSTLKLISKPETTPAPTVAPKPTTAANTQTSESGALTAKPNDTVTKPSQSTAPPKSEPSTTAAPQATATASTAPAAGSANFDTSTNKAEESDTPTIDRTEQLGKEDGGQETKDNIGLQSDAVETEAVDIDERNEEKQVVEEHETVELASALDGTITEESASIVSAGITEESSKNNGMIVIVFLSLLLVAGAVTVFIYRKRQAKTE